MTRISNAILSLACRASAGHVDQTGRVDAMVGRVDGAGERQVAI